MALSKTLSKNSTKKEKKPKLTSQGCGKNTKYSATSSNKARKKYRGQGK